MQGLVHTEMIELLLKVRHMQCCDTAEVLLDAKCNYSEVLFIQSFLSRLYLSGFILAPL